MSRQRGRLRARIRFGLLVVAMFTSCDSSNSTRDFSRESIEITRPRPWWPHWKWSGIPPLEGGWIPDPHFVSTPPFSFPEDATSMLVGLARYQGVDVNPWFGDETSEAILAIEVDGKVTEYELDLEELPKPPDYELMLGTTFTGVDTLLVFPRVEVGEFLFVVPLRYGALVMLTVELPLSEAVALRPSPLGSSEWNDRAGAIEAGCSDGRFEQTACKRFRELVDLHRNHPRLSDARLLERAQREDGRRGLRTSQARTI